MGKSTFSKHKKPDVRQTLPAKSLVDMTKETKQKKCSSKRNTLVYETFDERHIKRSTIIKKKKKLNKQSFYRDALNLSKLEIPGSLNTNPANNGGGTSSSRLQSRPSVSVKPENVIKNPRYTDKNSQFKCKFSAKERYLGMKKAEKGRK